MRKFIINSRKVRTNAVNAVKTITGEENLEVIIQEHKENKTQEQRNFFHLLCKILGDEIGYSQSEIKEVVKENNTQAIHCRHQGSEGAHRHLETKKRLSAASTKVLGEERQRAFPTHLRVFLVIAPV